MKRILCSVLVGVISINAYSQASPTYYNGTAGLSGAQLKTQLKTIITAGHQDMGYGGLWTAYQTTDRDYYYENDGTILDMYSENPTGTDPYNFTYSSNQCGGSGYVNEGDCYNREHIVPQSLFNEASPMKNDVHFIRATDGKVNGMRNNFPFGKVNTTPDFTSLNGSKLGNSVSSGYGGTVFEPIDEFKGDVARMIFYFVTRYESQLSTFSQGNMLGSTPYPGLQMWQLNQLLAWDALDPVSPAEIDRNNKSFLHQGNRNPYIDNPSFVDLVWRNQPIDTQAPTAATSLVASNPTTNTISLSWAAATDNTGVTSYDIYANGSLKTSVSGTTLSTTVQSLNAGTLYNFHVIAKDASGNESPQSNTASETTLAAPAGSNCGSETFESIPTSTNPAYTSRTWTSNGITWNATDARVDEVINAKAITIRNGYLQSSAVSGGVGNLTVTTHLKYSGTSNNLNLLVNDVLVGVIPYSATITTTTLSDLNIPGNATIKLVNPVTSNRVAIDDLSWTCYSVLGTTEAQKSASFSIYPNPVKNNEIFINGTQLEKVSKAEIYDLSGKLIKSITKPFINSNKINVHGLEKGNYILKTDATTTKFIVQ
ncbi:endonuclease [Chryseobacterium sp.]|uniref:endonuclease n=1 Tax=Chryseobacterium sp. TaxID=1871047 RepID=UPI00388EEA6D